MQVGVNARSRLSDAERVVKAKSGAQSFGTHPEYPGVFQEAHEKMVMLEKRELADAATGCQLFDKLLCRANRCLIDCTTRDDDAKTVEGVEFICCGFHA